MKTKYGAQFSWRRGQFYKDNDITKVEEENSLQEIIDSDLWWALKIKAETRTKRIDFLDFWWKEKCNELMLFVESYG